MHVRRVLGSLLLLVPALACGEQPAPPEHVSPPPTPPATPPPTPPIAEKVTLVFSSFTTAREAYEKRIIPAFQDYWRKHSGQEVSFRQSYAASRAQSDSIANGLEADVAALSLAEDLDRLVGSGHIRHDWRTGPNGGVVSRSLVAIAVPEGNPKRIKTWTDLVQEGLTIVTPDPRTSGGGRWNLCAIYGSALRGHAGSVRGDVAAAERFLGRVFEHVVGEAKDARESFRVFESGAADVAITSESEIRRSRKFGHEVEVVIPESTLRMDNPVSWIDASVDRHGSREVAEAFLAFLATPEAQRAFALSGLRPVDGEVAGEFRDEFPDVPDLWTIDDLGGWERVEKEILGPGGVAERAMPVGERR